MKKVFQILSMTVIVLTAASCGGNVQITYSDEPMAAVKLNDKWGYIDTKGNEVVPCKYDDVQEFSEGLAAVKLGDKWMYVDKTGKVIFKLGKKYYAENFSEGLAAVEKYDYETGGCGFIDKTGKEVIPLNNKYNTVREFHEGRAAVESDKTKTWGFIDTTGTEVIPCQYIKVTDFVNGRALVEVNKDSRDMYGNRYSYREKTIINRNGDAVVKTNMNNTGEFSPEGWALHKSFTLTARIDKVYFINSDNKILSSDYERFADANPFSEGLASVNVFNEKAEGHLGLGEWRWAFIDKNGKTVISPVYYDAGEFHEGLAAVQQVEKYQQREYSDYYSTYTRGGKWGFIDKSGKTVIPFLYETTTVESRPAVVAFEHYHTGYSYFSEGIALVKRDGKYGFIDKTGREVIPCKYVSAQVFSGDFSKVSNNGKYGIIDKTGREIVPCSYKTDEISQFSNGLCAISRNSKWGFVDTTGKEVIPCKYDGVSDFNK
jgi:hypothetical protein